MYITKQYKIAEEIDEEIISWTLRPTTDEAMWILEDTDASLVKFGLNPIAKVAHDVFDEIDEGIEILRIYTQMGPQFNLEIEKRYKNKIEESLKEQIKTWVTNCIS